MMKKMLVADDGAPIGELLSAAPIVEGDTVVMMGDGLAALDRIARECPALVRHR